MSHFVTDNNSNSTIITSIIRVHVKERILKNSCRETNFVRRRIIISIYSLRGHQPFVLIDRFTCLGNHFIMIEMIGTNNIRPVRIILYFQIGIISPFIRITHFYMECGQFFQSFRFCLFTHPFQSLNPFSQSFLQVSNQLNHTLFSRGREIFFGIHLSDGLSQHAIHSANGTFPSRLHLFRSGKSSSIKIKVLCNKVITQIRRCRINHIPL